jgi:hypothetical protein
MKIQNLVTDQHKNCTPLIKSARFWDVQTDHSRPSGGAPLRGKYDVCGSMDTVSLGVAPFEVSLMRMPFRSKNKMPKNVPPTGKF